MCAISRISLRECQHVFTKITSDGYVRGYDAGLLYAYFQNILMREQVELLQWPVCRELVSSVEIKRLENLLGVPVSTRLTTIKGKLWSAIFLETLVSSVTDTISEIAQSIIGDRDTTLENIADLTSNLTASLLYIFLLQKSKWRRLKNRTLVHPLASVNKVFSEVKFLSEQMCSLFDQHDIHLAFQGSQIVPIIKRIPIPPNLR